MVVFKPVPSLLPYDSLADSNSNLLEAYAAYNDVSKELFSDLVTM